MPLGPPAVYWLTVTPVPAMEAAPHGATTMVYVPGPRGIVTGDAGAMVRFQTVEVTEAVNCAETLTAPGASAVNRPAGEIVPTLLLLVDQADGVTVAIVPSE